LRVFLYSSLILLYIIATLTQNDHLFYLVGIIANVVIIVSLFYTRGLYLFSGLIFLIIGSSIYFLGNLSWQQYFLQFDTMVGILALFYLLPFLNKLISVGEYDTYLSALLHYRVNNLGDLYKRSSYVTHILGLFLNITTVPILVQSLRGNFQSFSKEMVNRFFSNNLLRAYALCLMWSPMEILVVKTISITNINYLVLAPFLIIFVLVLWWIDRVTGYNKYKKDTLTIDPMDISIRTITMRIIDLAVLLIFLVTTVTIVNMLFSLGYLFSLVLVMVPVSFIWSFKIKRGKKYTIESFSELKIKTEGLSHYFFMFLSAGFFVNMLQTTSFLSYLQKVAQLLSNHILLLFTAIGALFLFSSFIGFHPLVTVTIVEIILQPILPIVSGIPLAVVLITSSLSTVMYSPFNLSVSILSVETNENPYRIGYWNIPYAILLLSCSIAFAYVIYIIQKLF